MNNTSTNYIIGIITEMCNIGYYSAFLHKMSQESNCIIYTIFRSTVAI